MDWNAIWNSIKNFFKTSGLTFLKAIGLWIVGYILIKLFLLILKKILSKTKIEKVAQSFALSIIKFALYVVLLVIVLEEMGLEITGLVATLAAAGLALGLALQSSLTNVASGIILLFTKPFSDDDFVNINGIEGTVKSIKILTTSLITLDNKVIVLPNSTVTSSPIINYSTRKTRRVDFTFGVDYQTDTELVKKIILDVMKNNNLIYLDPEPFCSLKNLNDSSIDFFAFCWCSSTDYWDVYYYVIDNVFNEFKRNNINIPYQQMEVRLREDKVFMPFRKEPLKERKKVTKIEENNNSFITFFKKIEENTKKKKNLKKQIENNKKTKHSEPNKKTNKKEQTNKKSIKSKK